MASQTQTIAILKKLMNLLCEAHRQELSAIVFIKGLTSLRIYEVYFCIQEEHLSREYKVYLNQDIQSRDYH